jgi:predicted amidohydrolase YtcJ
MCLTCGWAKYLRFEPPARPLPVANPVSRRQMLGAGAALGAAAVTRRLQCSEAFAADGKADIVFHNGPVYTVNGAQAWARAVAVRGKQIVYVGDDAGVRSLIDSDTHVVDLRNRMLLPGFNEAHIHPVVGAVVTRGIDLQYDTKAETLRALDSHRAQVGSGEVVRGFGWRYTAFPPTGPSKEDLDRLWPDTPVVLIAIDGHSAWVNSKTLELAAVDRDTADPIPGFSYFQRDPATRDATGWLVEIPAMATVLTKVAPFTIDFIMKALEAWLPQASAAGITGVFDAGSVIVPDDVAFQLYLDLEQQGKLPFRVVGAYYHNNPAIDPLPRARDLRQRFHSELVQASVLKLNMDGGEAQYTAAMLAPYADKPDTSGETLLSPEMANDIVRGADREGIDVHVHSIGDRATRLALDAIESAVRANPPRDRRHAIAHIPIVSAPDMARFAELGVVAQFSIQWAVPDLAVTKIMAERWGKELSEQLFPAGSLSRHGTTIAFGTDWPAASYYSTFNPLEAIEIAVTRRQLRKPDSAPLSPLDQRITLDEALRANTLGSAYQLRLDDRVGSIEVGKLADLVVLDRNLFEVRPGEIHAAKVLMTLMNGQIRHEQPG